MRTLKLACAPIVTALLTTLVAGCDTGQPGAGFTNGPEPVYSPEKPAVRTDLPPPDKPDADMDISATSVGKGPEGGAGTEGGTGARNAGRGGSDAAGEKAGQAEGDSAVRATPPAIEAPGGNAASGETKPQDKIEVGTPRSPQL